MRQRKVSGAEWVERAQMSGMRDEKGREWSKGAKGLPQTVCALIPRVDWVGFSSRLAVMLAL